jgi:hypothetical protein
MAQREGREYDAGSRLRQELEQINQDLRKQANDQYMDNVRCTRNLLLLERRYMDVQSDANVLRRQLNLPEIPVQPAGLEIPGDQLRAASQPLRPSAPPLPRPDPPAGDTPPPAGGAAGGGGGPRTH